MTTSNPYTPTFCQWEVWQAQWEHEDGTSKERPLLMGFLIKQALKFEIP